MLVKKMAVDWSQSNQNRFGIFLFFFFMRGCHLDFKFRPTEKWQFRKPCNCIIRSQNALLNGSTLL